MKRMRVLFLAEESMSKVAGELYSSGLIEVMKCSEGVMGLLSTVFVYDPHAVVISAGSGSKTDDKEVMPMIAALKKTRKKLKVFLVVMGTFKTDVPVPEGVSIIRHFSTRQTAEEILIKMYTDEDLSGTSSFGTSVDEEIYAVLEELGITAKYSGQPYMVDALKALLGGEINPGCSLSKSVYPMIAEKYKISPENAARSIRRTIVRSWANIDPDIKNKYFGILYDGRKNPGNREYLMIVYDKLKRIEM